MPESPDPSPIHCSHELDHPLRGDPLHALPDAVPVPRRHPRITSSTSLSHSPPPSLSHSYPPPSPPRSPSPPTPGHINSVLPDHDPDAPAPPDPLRAAVVSHAVRLPSPPAGRAFATDPAHFLGTPSPPPTSPTHPLPAHPQIHVTVTPLPPQSGSGAGVFSVCTHRASNPTNSPSSFDPATVHRSLADFSWLSDRLRAAHPAVIVPPLPPLALAGRVAHGLSHDVARARGLARFATRIASHPVLAASPDTRAFLGAGGTSVWRKLRRSPAAPAPARPDLPLWRAGRAVTRILALLLDRRANNTDGVRPDDAPADARLARLQAYVRDLGNSLAAVRRAAAGAARARAARVRAVASLQAELHGLADREGGRFGSALRGAQLAGSVVSNGPMESGVNLLSASDAAAESAARRFEEVFRDYELRAHGAQEIMEARQDEQDAYERAAESYKRARDRLESRADAMWGSSGGGSAYGSSGNGEGLGDLVSETNEAAARLAEAKKQYETFATSTTEELRRLRAEMHRDVGAALRDVAVENARLLAEQAAAWTGLATVIDEYDAEMSAKRRPADATSYGAGLGSE